MNKYVVDKENLLERSPRQSGASPGNIKRFSLYDYL